MTELATKSVPRIPVMREKARESPPTAPPGFFRGRRWSWQSGRCAAVGHCFDVLVEAPLDLARLIKPVTAPLNASGEVPGPFHYRVLGQRNPEIPYALYYGDQRLMLSRTPAALLRFLSWHINRQMIEMSTVDHVVLHSAAASRAGVTVMLPGDQEHGKTTTVAGLLREGYDYVTDEAVAIDPSTSRITPFPKALSLDPGSWFLFPECRPLATPDEDRQWQVPAERLGSRSLRSPVQRPRVIVFPRFEAGVATRTRALTSAETVRELARATFHFENRPSRNLQVLAAVAASATAVGLQIGSLDQAVSAIEQLVSQVLMEEL